MARWKLTTAHYLKITPGAEYELKEISQSTGKQVTKRYPVPAFFDPRDEADCNYPGEIIVSNKVDKAYPRDIVFSGPPTPYMDAIDADAEKITAEWQKKWDKHPIESLPETMSMSQL